MQQKEIPEEIEQLLKLNCRLFVNQKNNTKALAILVTKILPLLEQTPLHARLSRQWIRDKKKREEYEMSISRELSKAAANIISQIQADEVLKKNDTINRILCKLNSMLSFRKDDEEATGYSDVTSPKNTVFACNYCNAPMWEHRPYLFPSYAYGLHEMLKALCHALVTAGRGDVVELFRIFKNNVTLVT